MPVSTARSAAERARGDLVVVKGATHSWLLKDPETLPAMMHELMKGRVGTSVLRALLRAGVDPNGATDEEIESVFYEPGAPVLEMTPPLDRVEVGVKHRAPRYRFSYERHDRE